MKLYHAIMPPTAQLVCVCVCVVLGAFVRHAARECVRRMQVRLCIVLWHIC